MEEHVVEVKSKMDRVKNIGFREKLLRGEVWEGVE